MSTDTGGLNYKITTSADLSDLERFRAALESLQGTMAQTRAALQKPLVADTKTTTGGSQAARQITADIDKTKEAVTRLATTNQIYNRALSKQNSLINARRTEMVRSNISAAQGLELERKLATANEVSSRAASKVTQAANKEAIAREMVLEKKKRGIVLDSDIEKARKQDIISNKKKIADLRTQLAAENQITRERRDSLLQRAREEARLRQSQASAEASLNRQRSTALIAQHREEQRAAEIRERLAQRLLRAQQAADTFNTPGSQISEARALRFGVIRDLASGQFRPGTEQELEKVRQQLAAFGPTAGKTENAINRISFTFRRLFGILAAFTLARKGIEGFFGFVKTMIDFNAQVEQAELGLGSIILASANLRNSLGKTVPPAEGLNIALTAAREQVNQLRLESLRLPGTFQDLMEAFQVGVAPGLIGGLSLDQIRQFTVRISQAAAAIGLPQRQLAEEIRSILSGTINPRNTRIAVALGISNADIKRAKEQGRIAEFLEEKFKAFEEAAGVAADTFSVLKTNIKDAFAQIIGAGGIGFFKELKATLLDIRNVLIGTPKLSEKVVLSPSAIHFVSLIAKGFETAAAAVHAAVMSISGNDLQGIGETIGNSIGFVSQRLVNATEGFIKAGNDIASFIAVLSTGLLGQGSEKANAARQAEVTLARGIGIFILLNAVVNTILGIITRIGSKSGLVFKTWKLVAGLFTAANIPIIAIAAAVASLLLLAKYIYLQLRDWLYTTGPIQDSLAAIYAWCVKIGDNIVTWIGPWWEKFKNFLSESAVILKGVAAESLRLQTVGDVFDQIQASVAGSIPRLQDLQDILKTLTDKAIDAKEALKFEIVTLGLSGEVLDQAKTAFEAQVTARKELEKADQAILDLRQRQVNVTKQIALIEQTFAKLQVGKQTNLQGYMNVFTNLQLATEQYYQALETGNESDVAASKAKLEKLRAEVDAYGQIYKLSENEIRHAQQLLSLQLLQKGLVGAITDAERDRLDVLIQINAAAAAQIEAKAAKHTEDLREQNYLLAEQQRLATTLSTIPSYDAEQRTAAESQNALAVLEKQNALAEYKRHIEMETLDNLISQQENNRDLIATELARTQALAQTAANQERAASLQKDLATATSAVNALLQEREVLIERNTAQQVIENEQARLASVKAKQDQAILSQPVQSGILAGLVEAANQTPSVFEGIKNTIVSGVQAMSELVSSSIVDAFDPTKKLDIKERFARFLQDIAKMIIQTYVQLAIVRSLLNFGSLLSPGGISLFSGTTGAAHYGGWVKGYAEGGSISHKPPKGYRSHAMPRPRNLHPSDTVPIFAGKGEYIVQAPVVNRVGSEVFDAINAGLVDPTALRGLAGVRRSSVRRVAARRMGYAAGGRVSGGATPQAAQGNREARGGGLTVLPVLVTSEDNLEKIYRSNPKALREAIASDRTGIRSVLEG